MFDDYFQVFLADTCESKKINYSIRYQVYCEEMGFENKDNFPMGQEIDEYDDKSVHFIVQHKKTGQWIGAMRLIFKNNNLLPIEQYCPIEEPIIPKAKNQTVELSRLCIIREIRRRVSDIDSPYGITDDDKEIKVTDKVKLLHDHQRINGSIIWGILNAASEYCYVNNIPNWYFMTTGALTKVLNKGGFNMLQLGEAFYHKGVRYPFKKDVFETYHNEIWRKEFVNGYGYRMFSDLKIIQKPAEKAA
ncbi:PEP-CTERM/exosortase system-associated acyltransferase [Candidatus Methylomicrobium oryzae]|uniref:PEP-CTERM/exosortase system-associated acyltransferase n=1 Tax=Candidatus Methylomicrobium oryzae TaxID=2802053 RepID=UPI0019225BAB|nr:PEP-CTERM/exosortase system-associated acyltransferase [Methylomicrobium sp. RS1]MBL1264943.1 PEP-CTERM/exosortase system-associated acyltransferase [Methylomicrobium sp. RS1]